MSFQKSKKKTGHRQCLLQQILQKNGQHQCSICDKVLTCAIKLKAHLSLHNKDLKSQFRCKVCSQTFLEGKQHRAHFLTHTEQKPYSCESCGKRFKRLQQCKVHSNLVHSKIRVQCNECLKYFGTTSNLIRHQIAFHMNLKRWICGICSHSYAHSQDLRLHLRKIHQYELNFIDYKSKKSLKEIYIIPALGTYAIPNDVKQKVEQVSKEEIGKLNKMYYQSNQDVKFSTDPSVSKNKNVLLLSLVNSSSELKETQNKVLRCLKEKMSLNECSFCKFQINANWNAVKLSCDLCNVVLCSSAHLQKHKSEMHTIYQCYFCNLTFSSKELCLNHIEKVHSLIKTHYQMSIPWVQSLISQPVCTSTPFLPRTSQLQIPYAPSQVPVHLATIPTLDYRSVLGVPNFQDVAICIKSDLNKGLFQSTPLKSSIMVMEQPTLPLTYMPCLGQDQVQTQLLFEENFLTNTTSNNVASLSLNGSTEVVKPNEMLALPVSGEVTKFLPLLLGDQSCPSKSTAIPDISQTSLYSMKNIDQLENMNLEHQTNQDPLTLNEIAQMSNQLNDNGSSVVGTFCPVPSNQHDMAQECSLPKVNKSCDMQESNLLHLSLPTLTVNQEILTDSYKIQRMLPPESKDLRGDCKQNISIHSSSKLCSSQDQEAEHATFTSDPKPPMKLSDANNQSPSLEFQCESCQKSFNSSPQLDRHRRTHDPKKFECDVCGKRFVERFNLKTHQMIHTRERPRQCGKCGKKFRYFRDWKDHLRSHEGILPFPCTACHLKFLRRRDLTRHMKEQHENSKYKCEECGCEFKRRFYLVNVHKKKHTKPTA